MENKFLGLRTIIYNVDNVEAAKNWYSKAFETLPYYDDACYVGFNIAGFELGLQPNLLPADKKSDNVLSYWGVKDIAKEYNRFLSLGATEHSKPTHVGGEIYMASVNDLWGNIIGLICNPEFTK